MALVVSTLRVMECSPLLSSDYPVLGGSCDLQHQMDDAAGRQEEGSRSAAFDTAAPS